MRELIVRAISGALYISIVIFSLFASHEWFVGLIFVLGLVALNEFSRIVGTKSLVGYVLLALFLYFLSYEVFDYNALYLLLILSCFVNLFLMKDLLVENSIPLFFNKKYVIMIFYLIGGLVFLTMIPMRKGQFTPLVIVGVFILVWVNDTFAYLVGKNFGKRKLLERISPKKTVEGFIGGFLGSILAGFLIFKYTELFNLTIWIVMGVIVSTIGTIGDLIESKFKRQAGLKDSGKLMPGHGGLFDRLDSIIYASPFIYAYLELVDYVS